MAYDKDNKLEQEEEEEGGESVSGTLTARASGEMMTMSNNNQESQCLKTPTKEESVHDQENKNDERKSHNEPVSGMTSGCSGGMLTVSSAAGRGIGQAYALQQKQQQSGRGHGRGCGSVLEGPPPVIKFGRGYALQQRHMHNEDLPNQHPDPDQVSDHPVEPASMGTNVDEVFDEMAALVERGEQFGGEYELLHQRAFNNEQVPATHPDPVSVPEHGPLAPYIDNTVNNANKNGPKDRTKKK